VSHPVYLLSGEEFLADEALQRVRAEIGSDPLSEVMLGPKVPPAELLEALETPSLLGGRRLVIVRGAEGLLKAQVEALTRYLEAPAPGSVLVLIASGRTKLDALVKRTGALVALEAPRGRRLLSWVRTRAREQSLVVDERSAWALLDSVGPELRDLDGALAQLATALGNGAKPSVADVRRIFPRTADQRMYGFTDAVGDRRLGVAMVNLRRLLDQGDEPLVVFGALTGQIRRMLRARRFADAGPEAVGEAFGLPRWRAERLAKQARRYREAELVSAMGELAATDVELKGGDLPPEAALERAVVRIVSGESV
jgi:DNA polymerase-3 subunit delta